MVDGLAKELLCNPLIESYAIELLEGTSSTGPTEGDASA